MWMLEKAKDAGSWVVDTTVDAVNWTGRKIFGSASYHAMNRTASMATAGAIVGTGYGIYSAATGEEDFTAKRAAVYTLTGAGLGVGSALVFSKGQDLYEDYLDGDYRPVHGCDERADHVVEGYDSDDELGADEMTAADREAYDAPVANRAARTLRSGKQY